ncbi:hypothetical protein FIBSPDRAFT_1047317 [Athelia psychrophila]|uniref:HNH nuclease domain-containing protein n=1 Tax=Athelia psychrophila TaxID=1759441 RepID=A0A166FCY1_9AGAM|nr:hypothetical protein FIBSPDRAFT_1047317 [Fibularhizoctonia sp. CBS 109695]
MAAAASPQIKVYAPLPLTVGLDADLNVDPTNWRWVHCLTLPLEKLNALQFSHKPYKWIRYAIGVVVGAEGVLSAGSNSPNAVEDSPARLAKSADLYYHISNEEKRRMLPADPRLGRTHVTSSTSADTLRRAGFKDEVARREGNQCGLTGYKADYCNAVHLLPHSRGDKYILAYTQRRSRDPTGADIIDNIDNAQNGLFLNSIAHMVFGKDLAFLMTPNFAMDTADVDPTAPPTEKRCTAHLFMHDSTPGLSGSFRIPDTPDTPDSPNTPDTPDTPPFPPAILFDAVYAGVVSTHFGTAELKDSDNATWQHTFYPGGVIAERTETETQDQQRSMHKDIRDARTRPDPLDMIMAVSYSMMPPDKLQARMEEARVEAEAAERRHAHEKVDAWMRQVTDV